MVCEASGSATLEKTRSSRLRKREWLGAGQGRGHCSETSRWEMGQVEKWEYMGALLSWDSNATWTVTTSSGESWQSMNSGEALNPLGEQGWELVSVLPSSHGWQHKSVEWVGQNEYVDQWAVQAYRAYFKRRKP